MMDVSSSPSSLLELYRRDRRKLLEFLLSSGLIKEIRTPSGSATSVADLNLDCVSTDYVLQCVQTGGVLDVSSAVKKYYEESVRPVMTRFPTRDVYFLASSPEAAGSPPRRLPPQVPDKFFDNGQRNLSGLSNYLPHKHASLSGHENGDATTSLPEPAKDVEISDLGLPNLKTGFMKAFQMMTCGNLLTKYALHVWCSQGMKCSR